MPLFVWFWLFYKYRWINYWTIRRKEWQKKKALLKLFSYIWWSDNSKKYLDSTQTGSVLINLYWNYCSRFGNFCFTSPKVWSKWEIVIRKTWFSVFVEVVSDFVVSADVKFGLCFVTMQMVLQRKLEKTKPVVLSATDPG